MRDIENLPTLGAGLGFRLPFSDSILASTNSIDFLEITADHFMAPSRGHDVLLGKLCELYTLIPHGLNLSLGSAEGLNSTYLSDLSALVARVKPPWWSEHISFTQAGGVEVGHLSPVPFNRQSLNVLCDNVSRAKEQITCPLILENITYTMTLPWNEIEEGEFLAELLERTDCGLLLDVTNLYTNSVNHGYDTAAFLNQLPVNRVVQLHYVGGELRDGQMIDNHLHETPEPIWELLKEVYKKFPVKGSILERDGNFPPFESMLTEVERCRSIAQENGRWS